MARPVNDIIYLAKSDVNIASSGFPNKVIPTVVHKGTGYDKEQTCFCEHLNYIMNNHAQWLEYLDAKQLNFEVDIQDLSDRIDTFSVTGSDGITVTGLIQTGATIDIDSSAVRNTGTETIGGVKTFDEMPKVNGAQPAAGNSFVRKDWVDDFAISGRVDTREGRSSLTLLQAGDRYMVYLSGYTTDRGTGTADQGIAWVANSSATILQQTDSWRINWPDGNMPISAIFEVTAPSDGKLFGYLDGGAGVVLDMVAVRL